MLKDILREQESLYWKDQKMIDYCTNSTSEIVITKEGYILTVSKSHIETNFCFGWGYGIDIKDTIGAENYANKNREYFIEENLKDINRKIEYYKENELYLVPRYYNQKDNCLLREIITELDRFPGAKKLSDEDKEKYIAALENEKAKLIKRLNTYLKRYGLSKLHTWTYCMED